MAQSSYEKRIDYDNNGDTIPMKVQNSRLRRALSLSFLLNLQSLFLSADALCANARIQTSSERIVPPQSEGGNHNDEAPLGIYVHIPYCRRRCRYCDFAIVPIGISARDSNADDRATQGFLRMDHAYRQALLDELALIQKHSATRKTPVQSIYFGGGTPSLAPVETIAAILNQIQSSSCFQLRNDVEITMEMDPGTFGLEKLQALKELGVNRISLGVQSFDDGVLEQIGRVHRSLDISNSLKMIQQVFGEYPNYSIDLISGLPGTSLANWVETLEQATKLSPKPTHLSLYDLQIESGTVFDKWYSEPQKQTGITIPSSDDCAFMYKYASGFLRQFGYHHYEISSYSLPGYRSRHNQIYWHPRSTWCAIGLGATSSVNGTRYSRPRAMQDYVHWVQQQQQYEIMGVPEWMVQDRALDHLDRLTDVIMTRLRTSEGLDLDDVEQEYGQDKVNRILRGVQLGIDLQLARRIGEEKGRKHGVLRLNDPAGFLFSNSIISSIFVELGVES